MSGSERSGDVPVVELHAVWGVQLVHDLHLVDHLVHHALLDAFDGDLDGDRWVAVRVRGGDEG